MDSAKNILHSIILATQHVRNTIVRYSRGVRQVRQHSLIRLELEFQTIVDASCAILKVFDDPLLRRHYMLDDRLMGWLSGPEPEMCLDSLKEMERLLSIDHEVQVFSRFTPTRIGYQEDDINLAIALFYAHKAHFHFLLTTDIWNYEKEVFRQTMPSKTEGKHMHHQEQPQPTSMNDNATEGQRKEIVSQKLNKMLRLLDALDCSWKHRETSSIRQSDTCMWLPATDAYRSWREGKDTCLWLQGKGVTFDGSNGSVTDRSFITCITAGAGKSVLASSVIDDLDNTKKDGELLAYFYCDFRTKRSTSAVEVMRSLLAQLTEQLCVVMMDPEALLDQLLQGADSRVDSFYSVKGLASYVSKVAELCHLTPLVVVDALDECREVETLLDGLIMCNGDVRLFVTSRPLQNIVQMLSRFPYISMDKMANEVSADILLHVTGELDSRCRLRKFDGRLKEEIRFQLCAKADGMFRWVQCQIDTLDRCASVSEIRRVLESLPEGLEETYRRILIAIDRRLPDARLVRRALVWLVAALRPMRLSELREALTIDPIRRALDPGFLLIKGIDFLEVSRSLVIHHEDTDVVTLSHMSVKDYLVGELVQAKLPRYHIVLEDAHERLARLCMAYISFCLDQMKECRDRSSKATREGDLVLTISYSSRPLLKYVLSDGFRHLAHLGPGNAGIVKDIENLQSVICRHATEWDRMCKLVPSIHSGIPWPSSEHDFTIYILVAFASDALFHTFLDHSTLKSRKGINPLVYAAHFGKTDHARALMSRGVNPNHRGLVVDELAANGSEVVDICMDRSDADDLDSDTSMADYSNERKVMPIQVAVDHWHAEMLDLLIEQGSTVPNGLLTRVLRVQPHQFPLYIIRRLLHTAEFVRWAAVPWDNRRLLEALVEDGDDYELINSGDELMLAIRGLVQAGCTETLLLVAVEKGCIPVVKTLLSMTTSSPLDTTLASQSNVIMNVLADNGDTPLHVAMRLFDENQCLIITKLLINAGCSPRELDADDRAPIHAAVARGFVSVVEYLLSRDVPLPSRILFTALQATVVKRVEMVRLLIRKGAKVHVLNPDGDALLHILVRSLDGAVSLEIAGILIDVGCDPSTRNLRGETPLYIATQQGCHEIIDYLILFSSSSDISFLLHNDPATQVPTLRSLIGNTDGLRFQPEEEDRVFRVVRRFIDDEDKCLELAKVFVGATGDLFIRSSGSAMLFDIAVTRGFGKVVEYLTFQAVPLPPTILFTALRYQVSMVPSLICRGGDVHVQKDNGDTLLHVAMSILRETQCRTTTQILVEAGCDPFKLNIANKQPIHIAVSRGFKSVVKYLLSHPLNAEASLPSDVLLTEFRYCEKFRFLMARGPDVPHLAPNRDRRLLAIIKGTDEDECLRTMQSLSQVDNSLFASDADGKTPLHIAIARGFTSVVDYLLSRDMKLPSDILFFALQWQPPTMFYNGDTYNWIPMIRSLVHKGANVHAQDRYQNTLLHHAMWMELEGHCVEVTKILIAAGCSASVRNAACKLPLQIAATRAFPSVVEYLLSLNTPFPPDILFAVLECRASSTEVPRMVSSFIEHGADACAIAANGDTVLHVALTCERKWIRDDPSRLLDVVDVLVRGGCDMLACGAKGRTPLELAAAKGYSEVAKYLRCSSPAVPKRRSSSVPPHPPTPTLLCPSPASGSVSPSRGSPPPLPVTSPLPSERQSPSPSPPPTPLIPPPPPFSQSPLPLLDSMLRDIWSFFSSSSARQTRPENPGA